MTDLLGPRTTSTADHLYGIFSAAPAGDLVAIQTPDGQRWPTECFAVDELDRAAAWCDQHTAARNVYVRATTLRDRPAPGKRGGKGDTASIVALWADLDVADPGHAPPAGELDHPPDHDAALELIDDLGARPTFTINTGGGIHAWWKLTEPIVLHDQEDVDAGDRLVQRWCGTLVELGRRRGWHVDHVGELARVLRVAGTRRHKPGVPVNDVTILDGPGPTWLLGELELLMIDVVPQRGPQRKAADHRPSSGYGPADAISEVLSWREILEPHGWTFVGWDTIAGDHVELWRRPGDPSSRYSMKCWPDGGYRCWSSAVSLPENGSRWDLWVHLNYGGDDTRAASDVRRWARSQR